MRRTVQINHTQRIEDDRSLVNHENSTYSALKTEKVFISTWSKQGKSKKKNTFEHKSSLGASIDTVGKKAEQYMFVSRSSYSFAYARAVNISWYCRLTFEACNWF